MLGLTGLPHGRLAQQLLSAEPAALLEAAGTLARDNARLGQVEPPFFPVADELADPGAFLGAAARGAAAGNVQVIIGTNRDGARAIVAANPDTGRAGRAQVDAYLQATLDASAARRYRRRLFAA